MIHLAMPVVDYFGAGTCGKYLAAEFSKRGGVTVYDNTTEEPESDVDAPLIQFPGPKCEQQTKGKGKPNVAYVFTEQEELTAEQKENLKAFDVIIAGSTWNAEVVRRAGFRCHAVPQGVDRDIFKPMPRQHLKDRFVIYSGGKWEYRKAQDLVLRAVKELQKRHHDIVLMASWFNIWENADHYDEARRMGVNIIGLPLYDHANLAWHMNQTDIGLFPNRCEGGTNLVMMDYMACGKPVAANDSTGQNDVIHHSCAVTLRGEDDALVEQMIEAVENLYVNRFTLALMGRNAEEGMKCWPWSRTADGIERAINDPLQ